MAKRLPDLAAAFAEEALAGCEPTPPRDAKAIHDPLLGTNLFSKAEVALIDCPLIQRLRGVRQTGLTFLVYPSSVHTRFEHTLGVATLAARFVRALNERATREEEGSLARAEPSDVQHVRMAALLHDVGHGFASHASERVYGGLQDVREAKTPGPPDLEHKAPHEILSYYIVKSGPFKKWFQNHVDWGNEVDLDTVAEMIVGRHPKPEKHYLAQIVSGPFDADKLDYIARDSYFSGLALTVDLERFFYTVAAAPGRHPDRPRSQLVLRRYTPLEQILFSKTVLLSTIYHHPKVLAADCMLEALYERVRWRPNRFALVTRRGANSLREPFDFLRISDHDLLGEAAHSDDPRSVGLLDGLRQRRLYMRALRVAHDTVHDYGDGTMKRLTDSIAYPPQGRTLRSRIHGAVPAGRRCAAGDIHVCVPKLPHLHDDKASPPACVQTNPNEDITPIDDYFPLSGWLEAYAQNKWAAWVFCPDGCQQDVAMAATDVLAQPDIDIKVSLGESRKWCKY